MIKIEMVSKLLIVMVMFPFICFSQERTDAQELLNSINITPVFNSAATTLHFQFSSANHGYTKEEIVKMNIKSISICLNNKWAYTGNEKGCIKYSFDQKGNIIQSTSIDSAGKTERNLKFSYVFDSKKNIVEIKITEDKSAYAMSILCKYDTLGYLLSKSFYMIDLPKSVNSMPNKKEEIVVEEDAMAGSPPYDDGRFTENYEYNTNHQLVKYEVKHGNITETKSFVYDSLARLIASKLFFLEKVYYKYTPHDMSKEYWADSISKTITEWDYSYDNNTGYVILAKFSNNGLTSITKYVYTKTGMCSEINETMINPAQGKWIKNYYDEHGRKIKTEIRAGESKSLNNSSVYTYTEKGSIGWGQKEVIFSSNGFSETNRTFDSKSKLIEEKGSYIGHTIGDTKTSNNTFYKKITFEYFQK